MNFQWPARAARAAIEPFISEHNDTRDGECHSFDGYQPPPARNNAISLHNLYNMP